MLVWSLFPIHDQPRQSLKHTPIWAVPLLVVYSPPEIPSGRLEEELEVESKGSIYVKLVSQLPTLAPTKDVTSQLQHLFPRSLSLAFSMQNPHDQSWPILYTLFALPEIEESFRVPMPSNLHTPLIKFTLNISKIKNHELR